MRMKRIVHRCWINGITKHIIETLCIFRISKKYSGMQILMRKSYRLLNNLKETTVTSRHKNLLNRGIRSSL